MKIVRSAQVRLNFIIALVLVLLGLFLACGSLFSWDAASAGYVQANQDAQNGAAFYGDGVCNGLNIDVNSGNNLACSNGVSDEFVSAKRFAMTAWATGAGSLLSLVGGVVVYRHPSKHTPRSSGLRKPS